MQLHIRYCKKYSIIKLKVNMLSITYFEKEGGGDQIKS